jgi:hypothetical protein
MKRNRIIIAVLFAVVLGVGIGAGSAVLKFRQHPWRGGEATPDSTGVSRAEVDQDEFNFGKMDFREDGQHAFLITNRGDQLLTIDHGSTSCKCTVSEIKDSELAPGQSTTVLISWHGDKRYVGPFRQTATIITNDPLHPEITLVIQGEYTRPVYAEPDELTFGDFAGNEPVTREARIFCVLPKQQIKIQGHKMSDPGLAQYFQVDVDNAPLEESEIPKQKGVTSGVRVRVTIKPGLPLGSFQQTITLNTNLKDDAEVDLPVFGSVGEVSLVGLGWDSSAGLLDIGTVDGRNATQRKLVVLARGPDAKQVKFKVASVEPDFLKVSLGETTVSDSGVLSKTELSIEIPEGKSLGKKAPADYLGGENGKFGEIVLETTHPHVHSLRIRVRFAVTGGG